MKVADFFSQRTGVWRAMEVMTTLIVLNVLVVLTSLPVITLGSSLSAAYAVLDDDPRDYRAAARTYLLSLRQHWRQSTAVFLGMAATIAALTGGVYLMRESFFQYVPLTAIAILLLAAQVYFSLLPVADDGYRQNLVASFYIVLRRTSRPLIAAIPWVASALFPFFFPKLTIIWIFLGIGLPLYASSVVMNNSYHALGLSPDKQDTDESI